MFAEGFRQLLCLLAPALLLLLFMNAPVLAYETPLVVEMDLAVGYDSNTGNSGVRADRVSDGFIDAGTRVNRLWPHGLLFSSELEAEVRARQYLEYGELSQTAPGVLTRLNYRHPGGFFRPTVTGWLGATWIDSRSELREGSMTRAGVSLKQPLTTRLNAWLTAMDARRRADNDVFSYGFHSLGIQLGWRPADTVTVYAGFNRREGGFVSSAREDADIEMTARAWQLDDAFGTDGDEYVAYQLDGATERYVAGLSWLMGRGYALDALVDTMDTTGDYKTGYQRTRVWLGLSYQSGRKH